MDSSVDYGNEVNVRQFVWVQTYPYIMTERGNSLL